MLMPSSPNADDESVDVNASSVTLGRPIEMEYRALDCGSCGVTQSSDVFEYFNIKVNQSVGSGQVFLSLQSGEWMSSGSRYLCALENTIFPLVEAIWRC